MQEQPKRKYVRKAKPVPPLVPSPLQQGYQPYQQKQGRYPPPPMPPTQTYLPPATLSLSKKKPWYRTGCGIAVIVLVALLACGALSGIITAATHANQPATTVNAIQAVSTSIPTQAGAPSPSAPTATHAAVAPTVPPKSQPTTPPQPTQPAKPPTPTPVPALVVIY